MKTLLAPSLLVVLMVACAANHVSAQSSPARGSIPFVTEAIPSQAPAGAIIQLRVQYDGEPTSLKKYRLAIGGVTARFFLLNEKVPTISAVVPRDVKTEAAGSGRVSIVFFDPDENGGLVYNQFDFLAPSSAAPEPVSISNVTDLSSSDDYYDVTFTDSIPVSYWGEIKIYFNDKFAEIVKMEDRVFTVTLPSGVPYDKFRVAGTVGSYKLVPLYYDRFAPSPTPPSNSTSPALTPESGSLAPYAILVIVSLLVLAGLLFVVYSYYRSLKSSKPLPATAASEYQEKLHLPTEIPSDLIQACETGDCVLYSGAGLSAQCGLPTWTPFVHGLLDWAFANKYITQAEAAEYHNEVDRGQADPVSDSLVSRLTSEDERVALNDYLRSVFLKRTSPSPLHDQLQKIKFSAVLTTNFDNLLENLFGTKAEQTYTPKDSEGLLASLTRRAFFILKLYGRLDRQETVVVAPAQYNSAVRGNTLFSEFMQTLFFSRTILFLGASLEGIESYLTGITLPNAVTREHYAVVAVTGTAWRAKADLLQRRYGIKVLPYTPTENFGELKEFVDKLIEAVSVVNETPAVRASRVSKLKRVVLTNIGPFEYLNVDLDLEDKEKWHVFLGDNGVGKSTVLKAIALALCGKDAQPYAGRLLRYKDSKSSSTDGMGQTTGTITLETDNRTRYVTTINRDDRTGQIELTSTTARPLEAEGWLAIGFPPLRTTSWDVTPKGPDADIKTTSRPVVSDLLPLVKGDVDPRLDKLKQWIVNLDYLSVKSGTSNNRYHEQIQKVFDIIGHVAEGMTLTYNGVGPGNRILVAAKDGTLIPLEALSQGTISLLGWIGILVQRLYEVFGQEDDPTKRYALVLMDEIDAHMHPLWQRILVTHLKEIFPDVQFIATTHSPLVVGGMPARQVVRFGKNKSGKPVLLPVPRDATLGYTDQVLTSMLFELPTSLDRTSEKKKIRYNELFQKKTLDSDEAEDYESLKQELIARVPPTAGSYAQKRAAQLAEVDMLRQLGENLMKTAPEEGQVLLNRADKLSEIIGGPQPHDQN